MVRDRRVCVIGAGPVGMAVALRLADAGTPVLVLDGGGPDVAPPGDEFNRGPVVSARDASDRADQTLLSEGTLYASRHFLAETRYRGTGGNSWHWGVQWRPGADHRVRLVPGDSTDFEARPALDIPAWAAPAKQIVGRYPAALDFFGLEGHNFDVSRYEIGSQPLPLPAPPLPATIFHFSEAEIIRTVRVDELRRHPEIELRTGQNLVRIETNPGSGRVDAVVTSTTSGEESRVEADQFVLALGGIENVRQLLLAVEDGALEDRHDLIGRWFMDHPHTRLGYIEPKGPIEDLSWYDFDLVEDVPVLRGHELDPRSAREHDLLRFAIDLVGRHPADATRSGHALATAYDAARSRDVFGLVRSVPGLLRAPRRTFALGRLAKAGPVHNTGIGGWSDPTRRLHPVGPLAVEAMVEQRPSPDNRVRLGTELDRFGRRLPVLQWSWSEIETKSIRRSIELVGAAISDARAGAFTSLEDLGQGPVPRAGSGAHHIGGTRQSEHADGGVVDGFNRVHGVENLHVVGSSVFPTSVGYANPTLTAVADGLRVADHLADLA